MEDMSLDSNAVDMTDESIADLKNTEELITTDMENTKDLVSIDKEDTEDLASVDDGTNGMEISDGTMVDMKEPDYMEANENSAGGLSSTVVYGIVIGVCVVIGIVLGIIFGKRAANK